MEFYNVYLLAPADRRRRSGGMKLTFIIYNYRLKVTVVVYVGMKQSSGFLYRMITGSGSPFMFAFGIKDYVEFNNVKLLAKGYHLCLRWDKRFS